MPIKMTTREAVKWISANSSHGKRRSKYGNKKTTVGGITFDSKKEADRWGDLVLQQKGGKITNLRRQFKFDLAVNNKHVCFYVADFTYTKGDEWVVEDCKGVRTKEYVIKRALMEACLGITIRET